MKDTFRSGAVKVSLGFLLESHGLPTGLVGEAGAVLHQVAGHELAGHGRAAHRTDGHRIARAVDCAVGLVVIPGENHFVRQVGGVHRGEQLPVAGVHFAGVQAVAAGLDELQGDLGALVQVPLVVLGIGRQGGKGGIPRVILAEGAFEQQDTGFQGHGRPFRDLVRALGGGEVRNREVQVLDHLLKDQLAAVAGLVEFLGVRGAQGLVIPRDVAEALDLGEIEVGAEE